MVDVVLITPPIAKACEPSLGVATLKGWLQAHGTSCEVIDANAEAQEWLLDVDKIDASVAVLKAARANALPAAQTRGASAKRTDKLLRSWPSLRRKLPAIKRDLRSPAGYADHGKYRTLVTSLNRVVATAAACHDAEAGSPVSASLADYLDARYCDMDSQSVRVAALEPRRNLFHDYFANDLIPRVAAMNPRVVGVSLIFRNQLLCGMTLAAMLREALPDAHVTIGGELISAWAPFIEDTGLEGIAHSIIPYEGEHALLALARALDSPEAADLSRVPNLQYRDADGAFHRNPTQKVATLGEVPTPDFDGSPWALYFAPERTAPMVAARGCYWNRCTFCPEVVNPESKLRLAHVPDLVRQMDEVHRRHGVNTFHFIDSALPARAIRGVADHVIANDLPWSWYGFSRLEPYLFDGEGDYARRLAAGGCKMLMLGLETGSQRLLDLMDKKQDIEVVGRVLRSLREAGILVHAYMMFGTPFEVEADAEQTRAFIAEHAECIQFMNCSLMNLARGSPMGLAPGDHGVLEVIPYVIEGHTLDLALYDNFVGQGWGRPAARRFLERVFLRDPEVRTSHARTPPLFDANHSIFLHHLVFGAPDAAQSAPPRPSRWRGEVEGAQL